MAIGFRRQHQYDFGGVNIGLNTRQAFANTLLGYAPINVAQLFNFSFSIPGDAFSAITDDIHQRPQRSEHFISVRVIAFNHHQRRHGFTGNWLALAFFPILDFQRLRQLSWCVMQGRHGDYILFYP